MEHLSPGSKVMMTFIGMPPVNPHRQPDISGIACAAAVGHACGGFVGQDCDAVVGQYCGLAVEQGLALGAAHPATTSIIRIRAIPRVNICLWFILFTSFRFLNR